MKIFLNDNDIDMPIGMSVEQLLIQLGVIDKQPTVTINNEIIEAVSYSKVIKEKDVVNVTRLGRKRYKTENLGFLDRFYRFRKQLKVKNTYEKIGQSNLAIHFNKTGNRIFDYTGPEIRENTYNPDTLTFYTNFFKWILPILFLIIVFYLKHKSKILFLKKFF